MRPAENATVLDTSDLDVEDAIAAALAAVDRAQRAGGHR
jgi:cytidylate kinase